MDKKYEKKKKELAGKSAHKREGSFSFLTRKGFRIDAPGHTASEAYKVARSKNRHYGKEAKKHHKEDIGGKLSGTYFKYDKEGMHSNYGPYSQIRPSGFKKAK